MAERILPAVSFSEIWLSIIQADSTMAIGFTMDIAYSAYLGADPWVGSNTATSSPIFALHANPSPPINPANPSAVYVLKNHTKKSFILRDVKKNAFSPEIPSEIITYLPDSAYKGLYFKGDGPRPRTCFDLSFECYFSAEVLSCSHLKPLCKSHPCMTENTTYGKQLNSMKGY